MITDAELAAIMPTLPADKRALYLPPLQAAMNEFSINTYLREAAFLAQLAHESMELKAWSENLNYSAQGLLKVFPKYFKTSALANAYARQPQKIANRVYASRMGNGDEASGDGWRYRGRGPIQLTGKSNYTTYGQTLSLDLVGNPDSVATPEVGFRVAAAFWNSNGLNALADRQDFVGITKRINGGTHGLAERTNYYNRAKQVLSRDDAAGATRGLPAAGAGAGGGGGAATERSMPSNLSRGILPGAPEAQKIFGGVHDPVRGAEDEGDTGDTGGTDGAKKGASKKSGAKKGGAGKASGNRQFLALQEATQMEGKGTQKRTAKKIQENDRGQSAKKSGGAKKGASKKGGARPLGVVKKEGERSAGGAAKKGGSKKGAGKQGGASKKGGGGSKKGGAGGASKKGGATRGSTWSGKAGSSKKGGGSQKGGGSKKGGSKKGGSKKGGGRGIVAEY